MNDNRKEKSDNPDLSGKVEENAEDQEKEILPSADEVTESIDPEANREIDEEQEETPIQEDTPAQEETPAKDSATRIKTHLEGGSHAKEIYNAERLHKIEEMYVYQSGSSARQRLAKKHFQVVSKAELKRETENLLLDESFIGQCMTVLEQHRLLLITGMPELGKSSMALYLAKVLIDIGDPLLEVLIKHQLEKRLQCNLHDICRDNRLVENRIMLFTDPFALGNKDMVQETDLGDDAVLRSLGTWLKEANAYLILTADQETLSPVWQRTVISQEAPPPSNEHLATLLTSRLSEYDLTLDEAQCSLLLERLNTLPRISRFAGRFFPRLIEETLSLEEALTRHSHIDVWFLDEIPERNQAAWRLCLAVLMGLADRVNDGILSLAAHDLAERLRRYFDSQCSQATTTQSRPYILHDGPLQTLAHLEYQANSSDIGPVLRFIEPSTAEQLWEALLGSGHSALVVLLPFLNDLAKDYDNIYSHTAAVCLGRIGELAPDIITRPFIDQEIERPPWQAYQPLAALFGGIRASRNEHYRESCLEFLCKRCKRIDRIFTFMLILREIGLREPTVAVKYLLEVVQEILGDKLEAIRNAWLDASESVNLVTKAAHQIGLERATARDKRQLKEQLLRLLIESQLFNEFQQETFRAASFTLVGLSFGQDPVRLASNCLPLIRKRKDELVSLMALFWLDSEGVFAKMAKYPLPLDADGNGRILKTDRTVYGLIDNQDLLADFAKYIVLLDGSLKSYPPSIASELQDKMLKLLKSWANDATKSERGETVIRNLFLLLGQSHNRGLWDALLLMLKEDPEFRAKGTPLWNLAADILTSNTGSRKKLPKRHDL